MMPLMRSILQSSTAFGLLVLLLLDAQRAARGVVEPSTSPAAVRGQIILARASHPWMSQQIQEPCVLPNPKSPGRLIMFYSGVPASDRVVCAIGKAWADAGDPFTWHQDEANPIFEKSAQGWDRVSIRLDCVLYIPEEDAYYIYYSGTDRNDVQDRIGLAICPAGVDGYSSVKRANIVRQGMAPVLAPLADAPFNETMASQAAVFRQQDPATKRWAWYIYYSYRGKDGILPGIRLATSNDGKTWVRHFNAGDPRGMGQIFPSTPNAYYEWHQVFQSGNTYVLSMEVGVGHAPAGVRSSPSAITRRRGGRSSTSTPCSRRSGPACMTTARSITLPPLRSMRSAASGTSSRRHAVGPPTTTTSKGRGKCGASSAAHHSHATGVH